MFVSGRQEPTSDSHPDMQPPPVEPTFLLNLAQVSGRGPWKPAV